MALVKYSNLDENLKRVTTRILENAYRSVANSDEPTKEADFERPSAYNPHHSYAIDTEIIPIPESEKKPAKKEENLAKKEKHYN